MIDQSDGLDTLPGGHSRGFTGLILAAVVNGFNLRSLAKFTRAQTSPWGA
jgi:hypothetical protein